MLCNRMSCYFGRYDATSLNLESTIGGALDNVSRGKVTYDDGDPFAQF